MTNEKRLLRSRKALIGGVCAGVADYFEVDPVIVRILVVVFTLASGGLLAIPYAAMWAVVPLEPKEDAPLDVEPQSVHSETYGAVNVEASRKREAGAPSAASAAQAAAWRYAHPSYTSAAHVPPEPPAGAARTRPVPQADAPGVAQPPYAPLSNLPYESWAPAPQQPPSHDSRSGVKAAVWAGSFLLFAGVTSLMASMVEGAKWWQYWPLIFVILGIARMVVPGEEGCRMRKFVKGLISFCAGATLLAMSLDIVGWRTLELMVFGLWPVLLMVAGLLLLGGALKSPALTLVAGVCFSAFCVAGLVWCSVPGDTDELVIRAPYGREYHLDVQPWEGFDGDKTASSFTIA